jgi:hypothetical protein
MKRKAKYSMLFLMLMYYLLSCDSPGQKNKNDFEYLLGITSEFADKISELEKKADESVDIAKAYRYASMAKNLKKDGNQKIHEIFELLPEPISFKVEQNLYQQTLILSNIEITSLDLSAMSVKAMIKFVNPDSTHPIKMHLCGIDKKGKEIKPLLCLNGSVNKEHKSEIPVFGKLQNPENFTGLVKFRFIDFETSGSYQFPDPQ